MIKAQHTDHELRKLTCILFGYGIGIHVLLTYFAEVNALPIMAWPILVIIMTTILLQPKIILPVSVLYSGLLSGLHWLNSRILLGLIFFLIFTPIAYFRRLLNQDSLELSYHPNLSTYRKLISESDHNDIRRPY